MSLLQLARTEWSAAVKRGVSQLVLIGPAASIQAPDGALNLINVPELESATLASDLDKSGFDKLKASLFVWLGGSGYRTVDAMVSSLAFIASLPKGSGVILNYAEETDQAPKTALHALASRLQTAGGTVKYLIQPPAVSALLRGVGFHEIIDRLGDHGRLVVALV